MAFKASNIIPARAYEEAKNEALRLQRTANIYIDKFTIQGTADEIYAALRLLNQHSVKLTELSTVPGIAEYAKAQETDTEYNVGTEFNAMLTSVNNCITWISTSIPTNNGYDLMYTRADGIHLTARVFNSAALSTLVTLLQNIVSSIE